MSKYALIPLFVAVAIVPAWPYIYSFAEEAASGETTSSTTAETSEMDATAPTSETGENTTGEGETEVPPEEVITSAPETETRETASSETAASTGETATTAETEETALVETKETAPTMEGEKENTAPIEETAPAVSEESEELPIETTSEESPPFDGEPMPEAETETEIILEAPAEKAAIEVEEILEPIIFPFLAEIKPVLKERKLNREIRVDPDVSQSCRAVDFNLDISDKSFAFAEFSLERNTEDVLNENLEIGNLPQGIDMTFLDNTGYSYSPYENEDSVTLQIVKEPGAQKGSFSILLIYTASDKTAICQINIINF